MLKQSKFMLIPLILVIAALLLCTALLTMGGLEPLVKFLYELEHAEEAMFDVQSLVIRPSSHKGFLKGSFTLACAYMRGDVENDDEPAEQTKNGSGKKKESK